MSELTQAEKYLVAEIRQGSAEGWSQFVDRYQGRLVAFARSKLRNPSDAEDLVQETFMSFVKALGFFREQASLETYLFAILRRKIINFCRGRSITICLLQDVLQPTGAEAVGDAADRIVGPDPTASWYARRNEARELHRDALSAALRELIDGFKQSLNFRDLKIVEMLFYCRLRNKDIAQIADVKVNHIAVTKHRSLRRIREHMARKLQCGQGGTGTPDDSVPPLDNADDMLSEIWQEHRISCLKRSTVGAYLLGTLEPEWQDYVGFHLNRLGCEFCRANLEDLQQQTRDQGTRKLHDRILESTVGFLSRP